MKESRQLDASPSVLKILRLAVGILLFLAACSGGGGKGPTIVNFTATPPSIIAGEASSLEWTVTGAEPITLSIDQGIGDVTGRNSIEVSPTATTRYTLTARDSTGEARASVTVTVDSQPGSSLELDPSPGDGSVSGRYGNIRFSATPGEEEGTGEARFSVIGSDEEIVARIFDPERGEMLWQDLTIDGYGPLTSQEEAAMQTLASGPLAEALAMIPLDLACQRDDVELAAAAAIVMPWQMFLKYIVQERDDMIRDFASRSACLHFSDFPESSDNQSSGLLQLPLGLLSEMTPFPIAFGYFPFDEEGALVTEEERVAQIIREFQEIISVALRDDFAADDGKCNGACGKGCIGCTRGRKWECADRDGRSGVLMVETYTNCGTHPACVEHDNCYVRCNTSLDGWDEFWCRHNQREGSGSCDRAVIDQYGRWQGAQWAIGRSGNELFDRERLSFEYTKSSPKGPENLFTPCPQGTTCQDSQCRRNDDDEDDGEGSSYGDPHLNTPDNYFYEFMAVGDYILTRSTDPDDAFEIQVRYRPFNSGGLDWSANDAVAMNVAGDIVNIYATANGVPEVTINGQKVAVSERLQQSLPGGGSVLVEGAFGTITWPDLTMVEINLQIDIMGSVKVHFPSKRRGKVEGLHGNFDGNPDNDIKIRNGAVIENPSQEQLYGDFRQSWRIPLDSNESLFSEGPDLWDSSYPRNPATFDDLDPDAVARAEQICRDRGIVTPETLRDCIFDVALTGSEVWAEVAAEVDPNILRMSITPSLTYLLPGSSQQFRAIVTGADNPRVTWTETGGGSIVVNSDTAMTYTAPSAQGEYIITATLVGSNNVSATATVIVTGSITNLEFDSNVTGRVEAGGTNIYTFSGRAGDVIRVGLNTTGVVSGDVFATVTSPSDVQVDTTTTSFDQSSYSYTCYNCFESPTSLPETGIFVITVRNTGETAVDYTLGLALWQEPTPITATNGVAQIEADLSTLGDRQSYSFSANAGDVIGLELNLPASSQMTTSMGLRGPSSYTGFGLLVSPFPNQRSAKLGPIVVDESGTYIFDVEAVRNTGDPIRPFEELTGAWRSVFRKPTRRPINLDSNVTGTISGNSFDVYTFEGKADDYVNFALLGGESEGISPYSYLHVTVAQPGYATNGTIGTPIHTTWASPNHYSGSHDPVEIPESGSYSVIVEPHHSDGDNFDGTRQTSMSYTFGLSKLDEPRAINVSSPTASAMGEVTVLGKIEAFTFSGTANDVYNFVLSHPRSSSLTASLFVYSPDPAQFPGTFLTGAHTSAAERSRMTGETTLPETGVYTLYVYPQPSTPSGEAFDPEQLFGSFEITLERR